MSHDFEEKLYQDITDVGGFAMAKAVKTWHHQELQKALRCGKDMGDGSICGCKLDCHLHDWRQRDELQKARHDWLREEIVKLEEEILDAELHYGMRGFEQTQYYCSALRGVLDRYQSELDQLNK